jgi:PAS domain S-box-containing protein
MRLAAKPNRDDDLRREHEALATARELVEAERHRNQELFDLSPDAYIITDDDGLIRECNLAASRLFGVTRQFLVAKPLASFIDVEARGEFRTHLGSLRHSEGPIQWRSELAGRDGVAVAIAISAAPMRHGCRSSGLRWIIRDDSEQDAAESRLLRLSEELASRALERSSQIEAAARLTAEANARARQRAEGAGYSHAELLGMLSHEIRTPLIAAHGYIEMLRRGPHRGLTALQSADLESIAACHEHLFRVLDNALATARLGSGHLDLALARIPVDAALQDLYTYVRLDFEAKRVSYVYKGGDPLTLVLADRGKLHQIMLNLLTNAVKFTPSGGSVTVSWGATRQHVAISVTDTGIGIAPDDLERVFEPYERGSRGDALGALAGEPRERGFGLGLAISRKLARAMGGDVAVVSGADVGSTFMLTLPRAARTAL